jgi:hypothetical protein
VKTSEIFAQDDAVIAYNSWVRDADGSAVVAEGGVLGNRSGSGIALAVRSGGLPLEIVLCCSQGILHLLLGILISVEVVQQLFPLEQVLIWKIT